MTADQILAALSALLAQQQAPVSYADFPDGPRVVEVQPGIRLRLRAPLAKDWPLPINAMVFGSQGAVAKEPSNARPDQPCRSPKGYPLHYTTRGVALVPWDTAYLDNDGPALDAHKARLAEREANLRQWA